MDCPVCSDTKLVMSDRQGIEIDYCPQCRGVWLDRGELDKLIERSSVETAAPAPYQAPPRSAPPQQQRYETPRYEDKGSDHYRHKKKKSLLGELFDF